MYPYTKMCREFFFFYQFLYCLQQTSLQRYMLGYFYLINHEEFKDNLNFSKDLIRQRRSAQ